MSGLQAFVACSCALAVAGCIDLEDFADPSLIDRPRVLAIIADPPEIRPGEGTELSLLVVGATDVSVTWTACGGFDGFFGGGAAQFGEGEDDEGCGGGGFALPLPSSDGGLRASLPAELTRGLFDNLELAEDILGGALPEGTIERVREQVGLPFLIEADVRADGKRIRAVKRVLISERQDPHTNPPPPHFKFGNVEVRADSQLGTCVPEDGRAPTWETGSDIELAPVVSGEDGNEDWIERYLVIDARGELDERTERAFYSWFTTGGELDGNVTKSPLRNQIWRTPGEPGCHSLWLVVRDGHGGTSACELRVAVGEPQACE